MDTSIVSQIDRVPVILQSGAFPASGKKPINLDTIQKQVRLKNPQLAVHVSKRFDACQLKNMSLGSFWLQQNSQII